MSRNKNNFETWMNFETWKLFQKEKIFAHRIFSSEQGWIERWNNELVFSYYNASFRDSLIPTLQTWAQNIGFNYERLWGRWLTKKEIQKNSPFLITGVSPDSSKIITQEYGVNFQIDFQSGYSLGLFLDQRHNRAFVKHQKPKKLLNCFAYTGSFSVMAALSGGETLSIDLSKKSLERAKENFRLNRLDPASHRFWAEDVRQALPKLQRRQEFFDMIILDPPTFARGVKGKPFQVEQDSKFLILGALPLLKPKGKMLVSTNCDRISKEALIQICYSGLGRRRCEFHYESPLPDIPEAYAAKTVWLIVN